MPKRTRSQRIAEKSRRALEERLDERFLFRNEPEDYGIDGSVEEFDADDRATGLRFPVQLKATDGEDHGTALKRSIPTDHAAYYNSLSQPLLMVRYLAHADELYVRWWHDPLPGRRPPRADAASRTFHWSEEDIFETVDSDRLAEEARGFYELRSASPPLPFFFEVAVEEAPSELGATEIELALEAAAKRRPDVIEVRATKANGKLIVRDRLLVVELSGTRAASYDLGDDYEPGVDAEQLAVDMMALCGAGFARWGQNDLAARIATTFYAGSTLAADADAALLFAGAMTAARRLPESLAMAEEIDAAASSPETNTSFLLTLTPRRHTPSLTDTEKKAYAEAIETRIRRREETGETIAASREALSLANHFRYEVKGEAAVSFYERAAELDPEYLQRVHYWHELGGAYFFAGRPLDAAKAYAKAFALDGDAWDQILGTDALLYAGRYAESRDAMREAIPAIESFQHGAEYPLKLLLLDFLVVERGISSQERDLMKAKALFEQAFAGDPAIPDADLLWRVIDVDGINPFAWWNLAVAAEEEGDYETAGLRFLFSAIGSPLDEQAWARSILHLVRAEVDATLSAMVVVSADRLTAGKAIPAVNKIASEALTPEARVALVDDIRKLVADVADPRRDGLELRIVGSDAEVESVEVPGARTREG
jgi:tetratricopeptide (TPR) repeat protein